MTHRKYNLLPILLLLIFLGQTTAANAMVCKMDFNSNSSNMSMDPDNMNHSMSKMNHDSMSNTVTAMPMTMDCCHGDSDCSSMGCIVVAVPVKIEFTTLKILTESAQPVITFLAIQFPVSLYRPPISA